jgi:hypothetical protein
MKKASIAVVFFVLIIGLGSAKAEIVSYSAPPQVYVGQSWNAYVVYLANDPALCNAESCPEGWAAPVYAGDFGSFTCTPSALVQSALPRRRSAPAPTFLFSREG